ncbi:MAG: AMP-binding protein, partial [Caldilineales bacterium]|nr:AMP-binding protein [Caldilineales bacterium]
MSNTVRALLDRQADDFQSAIALLTPGRPPLTFQGLAAQTGRVVGFLTSSDVNPTDRVAIVLPNGPEMAVAFLSVAACCTAAPLNPAYRQSEYEFYLDDLKPRAIILPMGEMMEARKAARALGIACIDLTVEPDAHAGVFELAGGESATTIQRDVQPDDVALVLHTSGTTSRPKQVPLTHRNIVASAHNIRTSLALSPADRCLNVMPLFHIHGLMAALMASLSIGASVVCTPGFDADSFFGWMHEFRPTWYTAVPTMHQAVLARTQTHRDVLASASFRFIRSSSASLPPSVMADLETTFGAPVIEAYGMTEASHQMASNPLPPRMRKPGSVGVAAGPEVAIMAEEDEALLPTGSLGEVVIRGENVTEGYVNNPEANAKSFTDGWFRTGDQGYLDDGGYLFLSGRLKEIINRGGEKVSPREVDEALLDHPAVAQAVTFALPHPTLGEDVVAAVVLRSGAEVSLQELRALAFAQIADFKVPSQIVIVDEIPKGPTGKLQRIGLHEKLAHKLRPEYVAPRDELEHVVVEMWSEVLSVQQVGVFDNFFLLGGDSLSAARL